MQKKFVTNLAFLLFLNLLIKPVWIFGIDRTVQNTLGAEIYGQYYALFNFSFLLNILLDLGITNFNNKNIAQHRQLLQKHLSGIITLRILLAGVYLIFSLANGLVIGYERQQIGMLTILLVNQVMISFILYLRSNLAGLHLFRTDSVISVLDRFIMIVICGILLWGRGTNGEFRIEWFIWAQTSAYIITLVAALAILIRRSGMRRLTWNPLFSLTILRKSYPFAVLILLMTFYNRIDSVMVERLLPDGSRQAGIYAQAFRLLEAFSMVPFLFAGLLLPIFSRMIRFGDEVGPLVRLSYSLLVIPAVMAGILSWVYRVEVMDLLYVAHVDSSSLVFGLLMISFVAICTTYIYGTLLTANGSLKYLNYIAAGAMLLNVVLNLVLIPQYKATGAAVSSLVTQCSAALAQSLLCYRMFRMKPDLRFVGAVAVYIVACTALVVLVYRQSGSWTSFMLAAAGCVTLALALRLVQPRAIRQLLRQPGEEDSR